MQERLPDAQMPQSVIHLSDGANLKLKLKPITIFV